MLDETPLARVPDLAEQILAFSRERARLLSNRPIHPDGERVLGKLLGDEEPG